MMHKVIFDTDPGVDDALALAYLARHPQIDLLGVTTVFGNAPVALTTRNARFLLRLLDHPAPVHAGAAGPLTPDMPPEAFPTAIHGENGLGGYPVTLAPTDDPDDAADFLIDRVRAHPGQVRILAVGRMTNLARAVQQAPDIAGLVRDVVLMGGAFRVPGNVTPAAEANLWGDPLAADIVLGAAWPVVVVPLDLTMRTVMDDADLDAMARGGGPAMQAVADLSRSYVRFYCGLGHDGMLVHDATAAVWMTDPQLFAPTRGSIRVLSEGIALGMTVMNPEGRTGPAGAWQDRPVQAATLDGDPAAIVARIAAICGARASG